MPPSEERVVAAIESALAARHFFLTAGLECHVVKTANEALRWEVFRGHLLDPRHTRLERTLSGWHVHLVGPANDPRSACLSSFPVPSPLVSIFWDRSERRVFITRNILTRDWDTTSAEIEMPMGALASAGDVYWSRELVGAISLDKRADEGRLTDELSRYIELAVVGVSRLPITSVETPLPSYSLGQWAYLPRVGGDEGACRSVDQLLDRLVGADDLGWGPRGLEAALRAGCGDDMRRMVRRSRPDGRGIPPWLAWFRQLFHGVALSPMTGWTDRALIALDELAAVDLLGPEPVCDLVGHMLRHLVRHLNAYDLVKFHSFGANYPDALWLDQLLAWFIQRIERHPELFLARDDDEPIPARRKRIRRRALRQAWLTRRRYEGHLVPVAPTSQGESRRVLPAELPEVPEQQIMQPAYRSNRLYDHAPLDARALAVTRGILKSGTHDLRYLAERRELGTATFLDRPLGIFKPRGAVDRTPLMSYEAFSPALARDRLKRWRDQCVAVSDLARVKGDEWDKLDAALSAESAGGVPANQLPGQLRPGVIMLEDAQVASPDFVVRRTTRGSLAALAEIPEGLTGAQREQIASWARRPADCLLIRTADVAEAIAGKPWLTLLDDHGKPQLRIRLADPSRAEEYDEAYGVEYPAGGLDFTTP